jgi:hypothetical protein
MSAAGPVSDRRGSTLPPAHEKTMSDKSQGNDQASDFPPKLAAPAQRALAGAGYTRLEQLTLVTEADLKRLHGMGPKAIGQLRQAMAEAGLNFADGS